MTVDWAPDDVDINRPSVARVYDCLLGGFHNFAADREAARKVIDADPNASRGVYENRAFLRRVVTFCLARGIDQFLDIGSGIPTVGNVHEIAQAADPDARVVYVDIDPVAVTYSRKILAGNKTVRIIRGNLKKPEQILNHPELRDTLDLDRPTALLMFSILWTVSEQEDVVGLISRYRSSLASGSYLALSQHTADYQSTEYSAAVAAYEQLVAGVTMRSREQIAALFTGFDLIEPGIVPIAEWRPDPEEESGNQVYFYGAVGRRS